ncbi:hypothetical protein Deima_0589 [Deinococcus maricopensis DSM 21211]|uniref:HTH Mu-type domain-containing protein n=1 Tax=Deinococcus maricopensis (strain DSM 21211 / LMG 22137 / NRRL B-23946 / LB-34) TaxID=709986 RepID=E8U5A9_DEIML|nr:hypothetical protein Deima_0589 [Deinococcus maricopensis DSM 21211]
MPAAARAAFAAGEERAALARLRNARDAQVPGSPGWALLERAVGVLLIHMLREVEGTFALERADAVLDAHGWPRPDLETLLGGAAPLP